MWAVFGGGLSLLHRLCAVDLGEIAESLKGISWWEEEGVFGVR
ncbi:hypothetical protein [Bartonella bovis]|nr:hypothetical protein [Bartonella bovis]